MAPHFWKAGNLLGLLGPSNLLLGIYLGLSPVGAAGDQPVTAEGVSIANFPYAFLSSPRTLKHLALEVP